jgi:hypothetical protein
MVPVSKRSFQAWHIPLRYTLTARLLTTKYGSKGKGQWHYVAEGTYPFHYMFCSERIERTLSSSKFCTSTSCIQGTLTGPVVAILLFSRASSSAIRFCVRAWSASRFPSKSCVCAMTTDARLGFPPAFTTGPAAKAYTPTGATIGKWCQEGAAMLLQHKSGKNCLAQTI